MEKRKAEISDIPVLIEMRKRLLTEEGLPPKTEYSDISEHLREYFTSALLDDSFVLWVVTDNNRIVATGGICFYALLPGFSNPSGKIAYITNIYTEPDYRKKGIATELVGILINEAISRKYTTIRLHSSLHARSIYERTGFETSDGYMSLRV